MEILTDIFQVCIIPLLGVLTTYIIKWINAKSAQLQAQTENDKMDKYIQMLNETITNCVIATNQTYVNALKEEGKFDIEAQKAAFQKTYESVLQILSADALEFLTTTVGDLNVYITEKIETEVSLNR